MSRFSPDRRAIAICAVAVVLIASGAGLWFWSARSEAARHRADPEDSGQVALGEAVYRTNCAACHGPSGEGQPDWQQRGANGVLPPPPHDSSGHTWHHADGLLFRIIRDGGAQFAGPTTPSGMPAFGEVLSDEETRAVVNYLKSFWGADERAFQTQVSESDPLP